MSKKGISLSSAGLKLIAIFILAFSIRLAMNVIFQGLNSPPDPAMGPDQIIYETGAQNIVHGKGFSFDDNLSTYTPGPAFILATIYSFFGINYAAARIGFSLLGALTVVILYFIGKELQGETLGLVASFALALYPMHFYYSSHFLAEVPFGFFISLAILNAILLQKYQKIRYGIFLGVATALSAYMKPAAIIYLPIYMCLFFVYNFPPTFKKIVYVFFIPVIAFILCVAPWTVRNYKVTGNIMPLATHGGTTFLKANNESAFTGLNVMGGYTKPSQSPEENFVNEIPDVCKRDKMAYQTGFKIIKRHLSDVPRLLAMKLYRGFTFIYNSPNKVFNIIAGAGWAFLLPFFIVGLFFSAGNKLFISLHAAVALILVMMLIWFGSYRYRESIGPVLILYGAFGFTQLIEMFQKLWHRRVGKILN